MLPGAVGARDAERQSYSLLCFTYVARQHSTPHITISRLNMQGRLRKGPLFIYLFSSLPASPRRQFNREPSHMARLTFQIDCVALRKVQCKRANDGMVVLSSLVCLDD